MNHFEIALQVLEKMGPEIPAPLDRAGATPLSDGRSDFPAATETFGIDEYIDSVRPLPPMTLLLGRCEDGLPILMDLENPSSGSVLISTRSLDRGRYLIKAVLASARLLNRADQVKYSLITSQKRFYAELAGAPECDHIFHPSDRDAGRYVLDVSALVEERYSGRRRGGVLLLAIDDLVAFERGSMDGEAYSHLQWIIREGPDVGIWPIVVTDSAQDGVAGDELVSQFGATIANCPGSASAGRAPESLAGYPEFEVSTGSEILRFVVPSV